MHNPTIPEQTAKARRPLPKKRRATKRRGRHPDKALTAAFCRNVAESGRYCDGNGLYLHVDPSGARRWVQRLVFRGKPHVLGLGSYALVSLAEARELALANRKLARSGGDPLAAKRRAHGMPTFEEAAAKVLEQKRGAWRNPKHAHDWPKSLRLYAFPRIGDKLVSEVTSADVLHVLTPIWHDKPETARRVRQRISAVMKWAVAMQHRPDNPAGDAVGQALGRQQAIVRHMRAVPHGEVAAAVEAIRASHAWSGTKLAFEFLVLTAARSGEVRLATWAEIDFDAAVWTVPAVRMKAMREHRVPLCERALEVLDEAAALGDGTDLVFPSRRGKTLSDMTLSKLVKEQGIDAVPHGFRSSFRDWAAERTNHPREVVESALAHVVQNKVEAAYARSDLFERRRTLMNDWEAYLADTHPHRPTAEPTEDELAGTAASREPDPRLPPPVDHPDPQRVSQAEITDGDRVQVRIERERASSRTAKTTRSRRAPKASRAEKSKSRAARSEETEAGS